MKPIFDSTSFANKLKSPHTPCVTVYQQCILDKNFTPIPDGIASACAEAQKNDAILCLDIETWPPQWSAISACIAQVRQMAPNLRVSLYGSGCLSGTMLSQQFAGVASAFETAAEIMRSPASAAAHTSVDFTAPSIYLESTQTIENWCAETGYQITESQRWRKPVYPYICPYFGDNGLLIPGATWSAMIWTAVGIADGLIVWAAKPDIQWDENAPWLQALKGLQ